MRNGWATRRSAALGRAVGARRAAGIEETEWQDDHGFVRVQVADPDGYRVELFAH